MADSLKTYFVRVPAFIIVSVTATSEEHAEERGEGIAQEFADDNHGDYVDLKIDDKWESNVWEKQ